MAGTADMVCFTSKNDLVSSEAGVTGVAGPLSSMDDVSLAALVRKLRSMVEKSESLAEESEAVDDPEAPGMSGAFNA